MIKLDSYERIHKVGKGKALILQALSAMYGKFDEKKMVKLWYGRNSTTGLWARKRNSNSSRRSTSSETSNTQTLCATMIESSIKKVVRFTSWWSIAQVVTLRNSSVNVKSRSAICLKIKCGRSLPRFFSHSTSVTTANKERYCIETSNQGTSSSTLVTMSN